MKLITVSLLMVLATMSPLFSYIPEEEERIRYERSKELYLGVLAENKIAVAEQSLLDALHSSLPLVRAAAVFMLGDLQTKSAIPAIREAAKDDSLLVRMVAIEVLARFRDPAGLEAALLGLENADWGLRLTSVKSLGQYAGSEWARERVALHLKRSLADPQPEVRATAGIELVESRLPGAAEELQRALAGEKDANTRLVFEEQLRKLKAAGDFDGS